MSDIDLNRIILLPELKLLNKWQSAKFRTHYKLEKTSKFEVCPKCATKSYSVHDKRWVKVQDAPIRGGGVYFHVLKRRFRCPHCKSVFTEPVQGIRKGFKTTERYRRGLRWACENFVDLKRVRRAYSCSHWLVYKVFYEQLELKHREIKHNPWPKTIGIDEHSFKRNKGKGHTEFATVIVDYSNKRIKELVRGKTAIGLKCDLAYIQGRENVKNVNLDMCDPFKKFASEHFPNADIIADKFHVLRLLTPAINRRRKDITGDVRKNPVRKLLLRNGHQLEYFERKALWRWLDQNPTLKEIYFYKEALHRLYRCKGLNRASACFNNLVNEMAYSKVPEVLKLRKTLRKWKIEILNYFKTGLTNARTEGFNNVAKLYQKRAFGYKNFENYRLRLLNC